MPVPAKFFNTNETPLFEKDSKKTPLISIEQWQDDFTITHDGFFKLTFAIKELAIAFLKHVLNAQILEQLDLEKLEIENGNLTDSDFFKGSAADLIYLIPYKGGTDKLRVFVILEHKSYTDRFTIFQLTKYNIHLMEQEFQRAKESKTPQKNYCFPPVIPIIIHHGETPFNAPCELNALFNPLPGAEEYMLNLKAILFDLSTIPPESLPRDPNVPELEIVLKIMQAVFRHDVGIKAREIFDELRPYSQVPKYRRLIRLVIIYISLRSRYLQQLDFQQIINTKYISESGGNLMPTVGELFVQGWLEKGLEKGREEGMEKGREKGREEGVLFARKQVIKLLKHKFGFVPEEIQQNIQTRNDLVALESLMDGVLCANSLEEFAKEL